jgi:nucleoside-diphosphate-sugar epimerase
MSSTDLPKSFRDAEHLEEVMTAPMPPLVEDFKKIDGDIIVLGIGGKMGPTLARMAKRAAPEKRVVGVARFSEKGLRESLTKHGIECIEADLLSREKVMALPKMKNVIFMAGRKFGSTGFEDLTWAMNAYVPALVAEHFVGSRIVAFSTGNVYPWVNVAEGGAGEDMPAVPPSGTYANSCAARENIFQYFSRTTNTPGRIIRLNYAIDMRYGVLHDVASKVIAGRPINLEAGHVNVIWQGDANAQILRTLLHCTVPSSPINISGPEHISVRWLAKEFARRFDKQVTYEGTESPRGWLTNTTLANGLFGYPSVPLHQMIDWVADWVKRDMPSLGKETHYDSRDGTF